MIEMLRKVPYTMQMLCALCFGLLVGYVLQDFPQFVGDVVKPIGNFFLYVLKLIVIPLMVLTIACSIVAEKKKAKVGKIVGFAAVCFMLTTLTASVLATCLAEMMREVYPLFHSSQYLPALQSQSSFFNRLSAAFMQNILSAVTSGNVLLFILIAFVLGFTLLIFGDKVSRVSALLEKANSQIPKVRSWFRKIAPVAMFFMFAAIVASYGAEVVGTYSAFVGACYFCYIAFTLLVYMPLVYFLGGVNPLHFFLSMQRPVMFAMATESSIVTIPYSIKASQYMGVDERLSRLIIPLGATFHLDGSAIYLAVSSVFVAACYGIPLTMSSYVMIILASCLGSLCVVGIPGGSLIMLPLVFAAVGIPMEGVALVAVVDRLVDMGRTVVSVMGDVVCTVIVQRFCKNG